MMASEPRTIDNPNKEALHFEKQASLFRSLLESSRDIIYRFNIQVGRFEFITPSVEEITGYSAEELVEIDPEMGQMLVHPDDRSILLGAIQRLEKEGKAEAEYRQRNRNGEYRWLCNRMSLIRDSDGRPLYRDGNQRDITERKQTEAALRESDERFRLFMENSPAIAWVKDEHGRYVYLSKTYEERLGVRLQDWRGKTDSELWPQNIAENFRRNDLAVLGADHPIEVIEETSNADGSRCCWLNCKFPFRDAAGNRFVAGVGLDITERERAEEALRESKERSKRVQEIAHLGSWELDLLRNRLSWSEEVYRIFGLSPQEFGATYEAFLDCVHPDDRRKVDDAYSASLHENRDAYEIEHRVVRKDNGEIRVVHEKCEHFRDAGGNITRSIGMVHDITERKRAEEALWEIQTRLALATSSTGIGMFEWNLETGEQLWDLRHELIFGYPINTVATTTHPYTDWSARVHPDDLCRVEETAARCLVEHAPFEENYRIVWPDSSLHWICSRGIVQYDSRGKANKMLGTAQDITARKEAQETLRESEERYRGVVENTTAVILRIDPAGIITFANQRALKFFGYSSEEMIGKHAVGTVVPLRESSGRDLATMVEQIAADPDAFHFNANENLCKDGRRVWLEWTNSGIYTAEGKLKEFLAVGIDATDRKAAQEALRESETRLAAVADNLTEGLVIGDSKGNVFYWNPAALAMHGYASMEECRRKLSEFGDTFELREAEGGRVLPIEEWPMARIMRGELLRDWEICTRRFDQDWEKTVSYSGSPVHSANGEMVVFLSITDITARKRAEEALKEADRKKDEFLAMLAHELRNPMAAISSATALLLLPNVNQEKSAYAKDVLTNRVKQLSRLVDDMLDVSRIIRGKTQLHKQEFDVCLAVEGAVEATKTFFEERKHTLTVEILDPLPIYGDPVRLEQVLNNFLTNAARYTNDGGRISLVARAEDGEAVISVKDDGIGISPALLPRIFDLFGQGDDSLHRTSGGLGIGLTLVKKLVELHGGSVTVISEGEGKGSEFIVKLPLGKKPPRTEPRHEERSNLPGLFILLAEDNKDTALLTAELLKQDKHDVDVAFDGPTALELGLQQQYDVILLDLGLPGMNGFDVAAKLRKQKTTNQPLLIAVSGYGQDHDLERAKESGIDYHLLKPVDYSKLSQLLELHRENALNTLAETYH